MFSPSHANTSLHEQLSRVLNAVHRAAFEDTRGDGPDPLLAVPVRLIPLVQTARSLRTDLQRESRARATLEALLDLASEPLLAVDCQRRILFANASARRLLLRGEPFCRDGSRLQLSDWRDDQRLESVLRSDASAQGQECPEAIAQVERPYQPGGRPVFLLRLRPPANGADGRGA